MIDAVAAGCLACRLLRQGLDHFSLIQDLAETTRTRRCWVGQRKTDSGWLVQLDDSLPKVVLQFVDALGKICHPHIVDSHTDPEIEEGGVSCNVSLMASPQTLYWVELQIETCLASHTSCNGSAESPASQNVGGASSVEHKTRPQNVLPTRLLDLGVSDSSIKLWERASDLRGEYACLIHCRGVHQPLKTLVENFETFKYDGISCDPFPKLSKKLSHSLGL